jgi:integrase
MPKSKTRKKKSPKRVLALPDLEQAKTAVLNTLTSASGQRTYEHAIREFVAWYCSEPRLAFNRTVVLRYRIHLEQRHYAPATINLRLAAVRRITYEAADAGLLSPELAAGIRRVKGVRRLGVRPGNWLTSEQGRRLLEHSTPSTPRTLRDHPMVAMLIGCGLRRAQLLALTCESLQQREEHWVIADLVGQAYARCRSQAGSKLRSMPGQLLSTLRTVRSSAPSTRPGGHGAMACLRRCSGTSCGQRRGVPASRSSHRTTSVARVRGSVTWLAANWIRFDASWGTSRSRRRSATLDANSDCDARLTTVSESNRTLLEQRARAGANVRPCRLIVTYPFRHVVRRTRGRRVLRVNGLSDKPCTVHT